MKYNQDVVAEYFRSCKLPDCVFEHKFCDTRRWRFDIAWPEFKVAAEVQGGLFTGGRHTNGAALMKEYEKMNMAAVLGWRVLYFVPREICMLNTVEIIRCALK